MQEDSCLDVEVQIDRDMGIAVAQRMPRGSTVGDLKEALARDDPTGSTRPADLALARAQPGAGRGGGSAPLGDDVRLDETLLHLAIVAGPEAQDPGGAAAATGACGGSTAMHHVLARTRPAELPSLAVAREVYRIINCPEENGLNYEDYEDYVEALESYWSDAIMEEGSPDPGLELSDLGAGFDECKYNENRLFQARGKLLEAQQHELLCKQYLQMLGEVLEEPWEPGRGVQRRQEAEDDFEPVDIGEDGAPVRRAMRTGYVSTLAADGLPSELDQYVDVRKIWCLSEKAARIGQARRELIESVLTAHAADVRAGGRGILLETRRPGRQIEISLEDIRKELDGAFAAKLAECTRELPRLQEEVAKAQGDCEDRERDLARNRREREEKFATERAAADAEAQVRYARELAEWREECRQADLRQEEERKHREAAAEAHRKAVHDEARRKCFLERFGNK